MLLRHPPGVVSPRLDAAGDAILGHLLALPAKQRVCRINPHASARDRIETYSALILVGLEVRLRVPAAREAET